MIVTQRPAIVDDDVPYDVDPGDGHVVAIWDPNAAGGEGRYIIVDGYHRYTVMRKYPDIADVTGPGTESTGRPSRRQRAAVLSAPER